MRGTSITMQQNVGKYTNNDPLEKVDHSTERKGAYTDSVIPGDEKPDNEATTEDDPKDS
jgi:hypothetical protein